MCDLHEDETAAAPELVPSRQINPWVPPCDMVAPDGFKLEFLIPRTNASQKEPVRIERFGFNALPLQFLDFIIEKPVQAVVLYGAGILVNLHDPARFAIRKLAVSQLRLPAFVEKKRKDLAQASALIGHLPDENPGDLLLAADASRQMASEFSALVEQALAQMAPNAWVQRFRVECWAQAD